MVDSVSTLILPHVLNFCCYHSRYNSAGVPHISNILGTEALTGFVLGCLFKDRWRVDSLQRGRTCVPSEQRQVCLHLWKTGVNVPILAKSRSCLGPSIKDAYFLRSGSLSCNATHCIDRHHLPCGIMEPLSHCPVWIRAWGKKKEMIILWLLLWLCNKLAFGVGPESGSSANIH